MKEQWKYAIIGVAVVVSAWLIGDAYKYKYQTEDTITVTGLGETEFSSDLIVWRGEVYADTFNVSEGYATVEQYRKQVTDFITSYGIPAEAVVFSFVNVEKLYSSQYNDEGNYIGQYFSGYNISQNFSIESEDVSIVEKISREISALIADGVNLNVYSPDYYYTKLDNVKLSLIEEASADARARAEKIAGAAGADIDKVASVKMGVFQITGRNSDEEYSAGGSFNTSSREKKARITMRIEYKID
ncbi:MAG: SIMPL domain-containing protein [Alistipes sp.]|nr:SIMPL domain-containing protein [Alistipes sp.]